MLTSLGGSRRFWKWDVVGGSRLVFLFFYVTLTIVNLLLHAFECLVGTLSEVKSSRGKRNQVWGRGGRPCLNLRLRGGLIFQATYLPSNMVSWGINDCAF